MSTDFAEKYYPGSRSAMMAAVQAFHGKHGFKRTGGEEVADLLILVMGAGIAADFDLRTASRDEMQRLMVRESRMIDGRVRVSECRSD